MRRHARTATPRRRQGYSLLEAGLMVGLVGLLSVWALPRLTVDDVVVSDHTAQAHVDLALEASLAARRDLGSFTADPAVLDEYTLDVTTVPADVADLAIGDVSVGVSAAAPLADVTAAAVTDDGVCWMARRSFGTEQFDVVYAYATSGTCNAAAAASVQPSTDGSRRGAAWSRPLDATPVAP